MPIHLIDWLLAALKDTVAEEGRFKMAMTVEYDRLLPRIRLPLVITGHSPYERQMLVLAGANVRRRETEKRGGEPEPATLWDDLAAEVCAAAEAEGRRFTITPNDLRDYVAHVLSGDMNGGDWRGRKKDRPYRITRRNVGPVLRRLEGKAFLSTLPAAFYSGHRDKLVAIGLPLLSEARADESAEVRQDVPLNERQQWVLQAMFELEAFDSDHRKTTENIVECIDKSADFVPYKCVIQELKRIGLIDAKLGGGGGCWMTPAGRQRAAALVN